MPYMPYDAINSCTIMALYDADPYHMPYQLKKVLKPDGTVIVAIIWVPSGCQYSDGVQPYSKFD
jgi:hypothetical protein